MIEWYKDKRMEIIFSTEPAVSMRFALPYMSESQRKSVNKYPYINNKDLHVVIKDLKHKETYKFVINKGYCWDGATIPRIFWRLIGPKTDPKFLIPSMIHDKMCENHSIVGNDRYFADKVFENLLKVSEVNVFNRFIMFHCVDNFQKFCKWNK